MAGKKLKHQKVESWLGFARRMLRRCMGEISAMDEGSSCNECSYE